MDTRPEPDTEEFADYCAAAGWEFIDSSRKFVVFKKIRQDAVPIFTEEEKQAWLTIVEHCKAIEDHINAIKELGRF